MITITCPECGYTRHNLDQEDMGMSIAGTSEHPVIIVWINCGNCNAQGWETRVPFSRFKFLGSDSEVS